ncbi:uncharacterized protein LOC125231634 [Leguminivora glycinivorella]|uniref:uncharacterized protein LOC125231634 n=1 Tax=Leguminivora glycinivorella TaxID=1035111 RepID=UPI00200DD255|nr:uncharacterized protein LOC125231634 [Leguminivora glycinivorella]
MESLFGTEPLEDFKSVSQDMFNHLYGNTENITAINSTITAATQELKQLIIQCNFDLDQVAAVIKTKSWDKNKIQHFLTLLQAKRTDLLYSLLTHSNSSHGESLSNFNWVLKLVLGSSELKSLKYPLVQLMLHTDTPQGNKRQRMYELNKEALAKFITVLENVELK